MGPGTLKCPVLSAWHESSLFFTTKLQLYRLTYERLALTQYWHLHESQVALTQD